MAEQKIVRMSDVDNVHIQADLAKIYKKFNSGINDILQLVEAKTRKQSDIWYIRKKFNVLCSISSEEVIAASHGAIYKMRKHILSKDAAFFIKTADDDEFVDQYVSEEDSEMFDNIKAIIISVWKKLTPEESEEVWGKLKNMLNAVAKYKVMIKAYQKTN